MKIIDFHQHITRKEDIDERVNIMRNLNIEKSIVFPYPFDDLYKWNELLPYIGMNEKPLDYTINILTKLRYINDETYKNIKDYDDFIFVPWISVVNILEDKEYNSSKMIKIIPILDDVFCIDGKCDSYFISLNDMIKRLKKVKVIIIHSGWGSLLDDEQYEYVKEVINDNKNKIFVLSHMKEDTDKYNINRIKIMKEFENVYCETSYCQSPHRIQEYVDLGFGKRILFGSDYRTKKHEQTLRWFINMIKVCNITDDIRRNILYNNANELLRKIRKMR